MMKLVVTVWAEDGLERYDFTGYSFALKQGDDWVQLQEISGPGVAIFRADAVHSLLSQEVPEEAGKVVNLVQPSKSSE